MKKRRNPEFDELGYITSLTGVTRTFRQCMEAL